MKRILRESALLLAPLTLGAQAQTLPPARTAIYAGQAKTYKDVQSPRSNEEMEEAFYQLIAERFENSPLTEKLFSTSLSREEKTALLKQSLPQDEAGRKSTLAALLFQAMIKTDLGKSANADTVSLLIAQGAPDIPAAELQKKYGEMFKSEMAPFRELFEQTVTDPTVPLADKDALLSLAIATTPSAETRRDVLTGLMIFSFIDDSVRDGGTNRDMLEVFLDKGAATSIAGGQTLAHKAGEFGRPWVIDKLKSFGLPLDKPDDDGQTPLSAALQRKNSASAERFLDLGVSGTGVISAENHDSYLLYALKKGMFRTADKLIAHGAEVNAQIDGEPLAVRLMESDGGEDRIPLMDATRFLLSHGLKPDTRRSDGKTLAELIEANPHFYDDEKNVIGYLYYRGGAYGDLSGSGAEAAKIGTEFNSGTLLDVAKYPMKYLNAAVAYKDPAALELALSQWPIVNALGDPSAFGTTMREVVTNSPAALQPIMRTTGHDPKEFNSGGPFSYLTDPNLYNRIPAETTVASLKAIRALGGTIDPKPWEEQLDSLTSPLKGNDELKSLLTSIKAGDQTYSPIRAPVAPQALDKTVYDAVSEGRLADLKTMVEKQGKSLSGEYMIDGSLDVRGNLLHVAAKYNQTDIITYLLDTGKFTSSDTNTAGEPALTEAIRDESKEAALLLAKITRGPVLNAQAGIFGRTSLHWAALGGDDDIVRAVLDTGIDTTVKAINFGERASELARKKLAETGNTRYGVISSLIEAKMREQDATRQNGGRAR